MSFWQRTGAGDLLLAQDAKNSTVRDYRLVALGTEVLIDRQGAAAFRSNGPSGYDKIKSEIEKVL